MVLHARRLHPPRRGHSRRSSRTDEKRRQKLRANIIDEAEQVALPLWDYLRCDKQMPVQGWHEAAFNFYQVGYLARFWLDATAIRAQTTSGAMFSPTCIRALNQIIADYSLKGDLGTAILAGQTDFLLQIQQPWIETTFQPAFTRGGNREKAAWGGLVETQNITLRVAQVLGKTLQEKFTELIEQPSNEPRAKQLFASAYTKFLCQYAPEPRGWLKDTISKISTDTAGADRRSYGKQTPGDRPRTAEGLVAALDTGILERPEHGLAQTDQPSRRHPHRRMDSPPH